jgi:hypothetical protein
MFSMEPSPRRAHTAPFTLHWVWHNDEWFLGMREENGSSFAIFRPWDTGNDNVILGPEAGVIQPPPLDKPVFLIHGVPSEPVKTLPRGQIVEDRQRQTESSQTPAGGNGYERFKTRVMSLLWEHGFQGPDVDVASTVCAQSITNLFQMTEEDWAKHWAHAGGNEK